MSVERFEPSGGGGQGAAYYEMDKASDGEWVRFEDYEKLHKELDTLSTRFTALIQQNNALAAENERLSEKLAAMESQSSIGAVILDKISIAAALNANGYKRLKAGDKLYAAPAPAEKPESVPKYSWSNLSTADIIELAPMEGQFSEWEQECFAGGFRRCAEMLAADKPAVAVPDKPSEELIAAIMGVKISSHVSLPEVWPSREEAVEIYNAIRTAAPSRSQQSARSPQDYAIEHAEYMAVNAESLIEYLNEIHDEEDGELIPDDRFGDYIQGLRSGIYEFRKRRDRCPSHESEQGYNRNSDEVFGKQLSVYGNQQTEGE